MRSYAHTGLKKSSLQRYRKKVTAIGSQSATMGYHKGVPHVLSLDMDKALAKYVVDLSAQFFGLTPRKLRVLAFEFTAQNKLATSSVARGGARAPPPPLACEVCKIAPFLWI